MTKKSEPPPNPVTPAAPPLAPVPQEVIKAAFIGRPSQPSPDPATKPVNIMEIRRLDQQG